MQEELGTETDLIPRIATGFAGGFGGRGLVCGAVSGGVMAIGIKQGRSSETESSSPANGLSLKLCQRFEERFGTTLCHDLTECDLTSEEGKKKFKDQRIKEEKCINYVGTTASILADLLR
jgi:C_GCAxxG_C_C family probable redox protein